MGNRRNRRATVIAAAIAAMGGAAVVLVAVHLVRAEPGGAPGTLLTFAGTLRGIPSAMLVFTLHKAGSADCVPAVTPNPVTPEPEGGAFSVSLDLAGCPPDFFDGSGVTLDVALADGTPGGTPLVNGQPVSPVPYALYAGRVGADCPPGYGRTTEAGLSPDVTVCVAGDDEMVRVGGDGPSPFWIDRFEASTCTATDDLGDNYGRGTRARACSRAGAMPFGPGTWFQAAAMCTNAGKRLCTNAEWQVAAQETGGGGCVLGAGSSIQPTSRIRACQSRWGALDMVGNAGEWVADWLPSGRSSTDPRSADVACGDAGVGYSPSLEDDACVYLDSNVAHIGSTAAGRRDCLPAAVVRGGPGSRVGAGVLYFEVALSPARVSGTSFRCCAGP